MSTGKRLAETRAKGHLEKQHKISSPFTLFQGHTVLCDRGLQGPLVGHSSLGVQLVPELHVFYRWLHIGVGF